MCHPVCCDHVVQWTWWPSPYPGGEDLVSIHPDMTKGPYSRMHPVVASTRAGSLSDLHTLHQRASTTGYVTCEVP